MGEELRRVADICHGCRRCFNLCSSFGSLFDYLDAHDGEASGLTDGELRRVTDLCYQCKLCYNHCPYTPPHRWAIDFPRLMLRAKAVTVRRRGPSLQDWVLGRTDLVGAVGSLTAPLFNWLNRRWVGRWLMERTIGIHRHRQLPPYRFWTFSRWARCRRWADAASADRGPRAALFYTCFVNYNAPEVGRAAVRVLERSRVQVACPRQRCCGMPLLDGGEVQAAARQAARNVAWLAPLARAGWAIVVTGPTCSYMLKQEYPWLVGTEAARQVATQTMDLSEYLMRLHEQGALNTRFHRSAGAITYHLPCHLRAQNIGYKSRDLMALVPGARVQVVERCAGVDGTWGLKREHFEESLTIAKPLTDAVRAAPETTPVSDCPLASLQIRQTAGRAPLHPVQVLDRAYSE